MPTTEHKITLTLDEFREQLGSVLPPEHLAIAVTALEGYILDREKQKKKDEQLSQIAQFVESLYWSLYEQGEPMYASLHAEQILFDVQGTRPQDDFERDVRTYAAYSVYYNLIPGYSDDAICEIIASCGVRESDLAALLHDFIKRRYNCTETFFDGMTFEQMAEFIYRHKLFNVSVSDVYNTEDVERLRAGVEQRGKHVQAEFSSEHDDE